MYHVSAQGIDERMINVHYYYYFTHNHKQVVNRLKSPQGLSTLLFHWWSEVPSRGGVHSDSLYEKLPALQRYHLSVFSECCFLELLARSKHKKVQTDAYLF